MEWYRLEKEVADPFLNLPDPLFIGGKNGFNSMKGWIDEIRITKGWRYDTNKKTINPSRRFLMEENTLALWHFDEGIGFVLLC